MVSIKQFSNLWRLALALCAAVFVFAFATPRASAQCDPVWQPFDPSTSSFPGTNGYVMDSMVWDRDGPGPHSPKLVLAGVFSIAGTVQANSIAAYDIHTGEWSAFGSGVPSLISAVVALPNGDLVAGGRFTTAGGVPALNVARWNGSSWSALGSGVGNQTGDVTSLAVMPNGDLIAAAEYTPPMGALTFRVMRWNESTGSWSPLGADFSGYISALLVLPNGDLIAAGLIDNIGGVPARGIARWNGVSWSEVGGGIDGWVYDMAMNAQGHVVAVGSFDTAGEVNASHVAIWNGTDWSALSDVTYMDVKAVKVLANDDIVIGGDFDTLLGMQVNNLAKWNGSSWSAVGSGVNNRVNSLVELPDGRLIAAGDFTRSGAKAACTVACWRSGEWFALGTGANNAVSAVTVLPDGGLAAVGYFTSVGGVNASRIARWHPDSDGGHWTALGSGVAESTNNEMTSVVSLTNGDIVVGGRRINNIGGVNAWGSIARWNGSAWSAIGTNNLTNGSGVSALLALSDGNFIAGGNLAVEGPFVFGNIARWNQSAWVPFPPGLNSDVLALHLLPNGDLIAGGIFTFSGETVVNGIARWNGSVWMPLGTGVAASSNPGILAITALPNGDVIAGGVFTSAGGNANARNIARWNGSAWLPMGTGVNSAVRSLVAMPNGIVFAGGSFRNAGGVPANYIARWEGSGAGGWSSLSAGVGGVTTPVVNALAMMPNGDLVVAGRFLTAGQVVAPYIARWATPVPPTITDQPQTRSISTGDTLVLTASLASGSASVSIQWQRNGINITNGPGGASPGGGTVVGAAGSMGSITNGTPASLYISNFQPSDAGSYTATFSNTCGSVTSLPATITIAPPPCPADFNADTVLDFFDYLDFVSAFAANEPAADFNADTVIDFFDYLDFVADFANGC